MKPADVAPALPGEHTAVMWAARLAPGRTPGLELVGEHGPASHAHAGSRAAVFEGVLYNRADLEQVLEAPGGTDAAVVLSAYERWGVDALLKIKGVFALAIWDGDSHSAVLARDPLGIYPLFYADRGEELLLSTSIDAVLACDGVSSALNRAALADHLCHRWPDREETYFESIKRVPACHALLIERGVHRLHRYWDPGPPGQEMNWVTEDELDEGFHELFEQAVARCLSLGPAGIFLSSGLDSVSVAGVASDLCRAQGEGLPLAMSVSFPDPECNEELAQRAIARDLGLEQIMLPLDDSVQPHGLLRKSCELQAGRSAPMLSYYAPPYMQLAEVARSRGYKVVMTGGGGDEWLCVTPLLAADLIRAGDVRGLIRLVRNMRRSFNLPAWKVWQNALWTFGGRQVVGRMVGSVLPRVAPGLQRKYRRRIVSEGIPEWVAPDSDLRGEIERRNLAAWPEPPTDGWYRHDIRVGLDHPVAAMEMEEFFENMPLTGVRTMCPFMDADLVDFLYRVPPELLDRGGRSKGLVRHELARRFPDLDFERHKKITALSFSRNIAQAQGEGAWKASGGAPALAELGVIDPKGFEHELREVLSGRAEQAYHVWDVLNLEAWTRSRI
jgi:asparagine synthase (glutamine-hydrolysing)